MKEKFYITTAIAYTSGKPHIGNTYEAILADSIARFKRKQGYDVLFQTGTDEHGQKIEDKAKAAGKSPKEFVDEVAGEIKRIWKTVNVSYDKFIRTTDDDHMKEVQKIFKKLYEQGDIYKGEYEGSYCEPCESFWTESQLIDGKCPDCGREVKKAKEEAYFFRMSKYADRLLKYYEEHPEFIVPVARKNEMINNFLKPGLQDLCVSRSSFKWGIPVDFDDKHVVYVWLDALTNYITGIGYDADGCHKDNYKKYWPADIHVIGKDIVRFHTIYWPIFLMALGEPLPKRVYGHGWLLQEGGKMSKSVGNVLYADDLVKLFGVDAVRYYVLTAMPTESDGVISYEAIIDAINGELVNIFGNLVSRTAAMANKYFGGEIENKNAVESVDDDLKKVVCSTYEKVAAKIDECKISDAISEVFTLFRRANKYIDETCPWILAKDPEKADRLSTVLYNLSESIIIGASLLYPFIPDTAIKAAKIMGQSLRDYDAIGKFGIAGKTKAVENADKLFDRIDKEEFMKGINMNTENKEVKEEKTNLIDIEDFAKVEIKIAKVIACEKVEKSKKLLKLTVKIGNEERTVVSGISNYYAPEDLVGKKLAMIVNLKPVKLCGIESQGMIICAEDEKAGVVAYLSPEKDVEEGSKVF